MSAGALDFLEYLARAQPSGPERYQPQYKAEQPVEWDLTAMLESPLVEPINGARYEEAVAVVRTLVADQEVEAHD